MAGRRSSTKSQPGKCQEGPMMLLLREPLKFLALFRIPVHAIPRLGRVLRGVEVYSAGCPSWAPGMGPYAVLKGICSLRPCFVGCLRQHSNGFVRIPDWGTMESTLVIGLRIATLIGRGVQASRQHMQKPEFLSISRPLPAQAVPVHEQRSSLLLNCCHISGRHACTYEPQGWVDIVWVHHTSIGRPRNDSSFLDLKSM